MSELLHYLLPNRFYDLHGLVTRSAIRRTRAGFDGHESQPYPRPSLRRRGPTAGCPPGRRASPRTPWRCRRYQLSYLGSYSDSLPWRLPDLTAKTPKRQNAKRRFGVRPRRGAASRDGLSRGSRFRGGGAVTHVPGLAVTHVPGLRHEPSVPSAASLTPIPAYSSGVLAFWRFKNLGVVQARDGRAWARSVSAVAAAEWTR